MPRARPPYPEEFRREAIELVRISSKPQRQIAEGDRADSSSVVRRRGRRVFKLLLGGHWYGHRELVRREALPLANVHASTPIAIATQFDAAPLNARITGRPLRDHLPYQKLSTGFDTRH